MMQIKRSFTTCIRNIDQAKVRRTGILVMNKIIDTEFSISG